MTHSANRWSGPLTQHLARLRVVEKTGPRNRQSDTGRLVGTAADFSSSCESFLLSRTVLGRAIIRHRCRGFSSLQPYLVLSYLVFTRFVEAGKTLASPPRCWPRGAGPPSSASAILRKTQTPIEANKVKHVRKHEEGMKRETVASGRGGKGDGEVDHRDRASAEEPLAMRVLCFRQIRRPCLPGESPWRIPLSFPLTLVLRLKSCVR